MSTPSAAGTAPTVPRDRQRHPCVPCQRRKVKCDRNYPCLNCEKAGKECISPSSLPPRKRKKRFPEAELLARLRRYEEHLRRYGADIDAINNEALGPATTSFTPVTSPENLHEAVRTLSVSRTFKHLESHKFFGINEEFQEAQEILQGSSDDEEFENPMLRTYDTIVGDGADLLFATPATQNIRELHPSPVDIFRLWQLYLDNINPLIKMFHAPTTQQQILDASANLENVSPAIEALIFGIYAVVTATLTEPDCLSMFLEEKAVLIKRYSDGCRHALLKAGFMRTSDITVLQAFVLYLMSCLIQQPTVDPRSLFCLLGIAVRIAQRMGLNYDGTSYNLPPFEVEMRRRLWWQILILDFRVSEISGAGSSVLHHVWTTKLPLNVNDSDLYPDMKDVPTEHPGLTEMIFVLHRCEAILLMHNLRGSQLSMSEKQKAVDKLKDRLETRCRQYCDHSVPLYLMTTLMTTSAMCKLHLGPLLPHLVSPTKMWPRLDDSDPMFKVSIEMLEAHQAMLKAPSLGRFMWHIMTNFPFPAILFILSTLKYRPVGPLVDKAWELIGESFALRETLWKNYKGNERFKASTVHLAMANLTVKAWDARLRLFPETPEPKFIMDLKERLGTRTRETSTELSASETATSIPSPDQWTDMNFDPHATYASLWDDWSQVQIPLDTMHMTPMILDGTQGMYYT